MKKILIALVAILALTQCKPAETGSQGSTDFMTAVTEYGIYNGVSALVGYDIDKHQTITSKTPSYRFVMQSDDQTQYFTAEFIALPDAVKMTVDVDLKVVGTAGFKDGVRKMELVKIQADKAWLWSEDEKLGVVVAVPLY